MRASRAIALAALLIVVALIVRAPARVLDAPVAEATQGRVRLADAGGTLWNGRADLVVAGTAGRLPIQWHIDFLPLLAGSVEGTLLPGSAATPAMFAISRHQARVRDLALDAPASMLLALLPGPVAAAASASGRIELRAPALLWQRDAVDGNADVRWRDAALRVDALGQGFALGDVDVHAQGDGGRLNGIIANQGGELALAGTASIGPDARARLDLSARPREQLEPERARALDALLRAVAPVDASGTFRVVVQ
jgi:hypothetical protein